MPVKADTTSITDAVSRALSDETFSDMTITCGGEVFNVHRVIVCSQSSFFYVAMAGSFKVCPAVRSLSGENNLTNMP
jgi:hypothetical protein